MEKSTYAWNLPQNCGPLASRLAADGCTRIWVKAGVDNPGLRTVWRQWSDARCEAFEAVGIEAVAWMYIYPESPETQWDTIARALLARPSRDICLNAEVEWDDYAPSYVANWVGGLRAHLAARGVQVERIGFSSVPSWDGAKGSQYHRFPYEAFCEACDFSMPQCYWSVPNQAAFENERNTTGKPVIPIMTACGEYDDAGVLAIARLTLATCNHFAGFSSWECANGAYQFDAMRRVYLMLPELAAQVTTPGRPPRWVAWGPYGCGIGGGIRDYLETIPENLRLPLIGFPITEEVQENGITVQYFERQRIEWHADGAKLGRLGVEVARARGLTEVF